MRRIVHFLFSAALLGAATLTATAGGASADPSPPASLCADAVTATFGPNVCVFTPQMSQTQIQDDLNNIAAQQVPLSAQFNNDGYAVLFEPGTYGSAATPLVFEVGYYTEVAGLGAVPQDTTINGQIEVFPNALDCASSTNCWANSTVNFWRSMSNLTLNVMDSANNYVPQPITQLPPIGDSADCYGGSTDMWSVSQATPVRSMIINGTLNFQAYCSQTGYGSNDYGSGSYVANSEINGQLDWSGNQQGIARNSDFESAAGYVWNYVYSGDGCPPGYTPPAGSACSPNQDAFGSSPTGTKGVIGVDQVTELPQSPVTEEEPFLYTNSSGKFSAFVPSVQQNSSGPNFLSLAAAVVILRGEPEHAGRGDQPGAAGREEPRADAGRLRPVRADRRRPPGHGGPRPRLRHAGAAARQRGAHRAAQRRGEDLRAHRRRRPGELSGAGLGGRPRPDGRHRRRP
jgi:hypothetical protein